MKINKVYLAEIYDPASPEWGTLTMYVVFGTIYHREDIPDINVALKPYGIDDDDVHFYFTEEDLQNIKNGKIIDENNYKITILEEVKPDV